MHEPIQPQVTVQFLNGSTLEKEITVTVARGGLGPIRSQIDPSSLVADTGDSITIPFLAADAVPDRIRYMYRRPRLDNVRSRDAFTFGSQTIPRGAVVPRQVKRSVLLLLESPHTAETTRALKPVYPAAGDTGGAIHRQKDKLAFLLDQIPAERFAGKAPFILANPVPHPTSCRSAPLNDHLRNRLMEFALTEVHWITEGFHRRLRDYRPVVIINACTGKGSRNGLPSLSRRKLDPKELVRRALWTFFDGKPVYRICCNRKKVQVDGQVRNVLKMQHFPLEGNEKPAYYVVDFPHPGSWHGIWSEGWFQEP
ncbi:hypothetical protein KRR26_28555 [Corallococcus sp. M34]|uniref:hypothetical protein n=1 Tax=Citreicoccus inhibens TaxID=2849499 RepID=UPI001C2295A8|nr:hypothetical protein [Citreicoccus inhibens]MBU8899567.1 hypothetical protein [Citreicoccus inhibens]